jgi:hypothetical protein
MAETPEMPEELPLAGEAAETASGGGAVASREICGGAPTSQRGDPSTGSGQVLGHPEVGAGESAAAEAGEIGGNEGETREEMPVIDVHDAHHAASSWKEFFTHIATIVLGLLIAVGLEQGVEHFRNRHELADTREALRREREHNIKQLAVSTTEMRWETAEYQNNLLVFEYLQQHPGTPQENLPGVLRWSHTGTQFSFAAWDAASQSGMTRMMPLVEAAQQARLYRDLETAHNEAEEEYAASHKAEAYTYRDYDPSHLTPAQVADEIELTQTLLMQHYRHVLGLYIVGLDDPDFTPAPTQADLEKLSHSPDQQTKGLLAPAYALTLERMKAAGYVPYNVTSDEWIASGGTKK